MDPSGTFIQYDAKAIGSGSEGAQQALQDVYHKVFTDNGDEDDSDINNFNNI